MTSQADLFAPAPAGIRPGITYNGTVRVRHLADVLQRHGHEPDGTPCHVVTADDALAT